MEHAAIAGDVGAQKAHVDRAQAMSLITRLLAIATQETRVVTQESGKFPSFEWRQHMYTKTPASQLDNPAVTHAAVCSALGSAAAECIPAVPSRSGNTHEHAHWTGLAREVAARRSDELRAAWWPGPKAAAAGIPATSAGASGLGTSWACDGASADERDRMLPAVQSILATNGTGLSTQSEEEALQAAGKGSSPWAIRASLASGDGAGAQAHADAQAWRIISPWHDIPLANDDGTLNMVVEVPKLTRCKLEAAVQEAWNPIRQDTKRGKLRMYDWGDCPGNYGFMPQTYEDPAHVHPDTGAAGDADPLDIIEVGGRVWATGSVIRVKPIGVVPMIDSGEMDWKILAIAAHDPRAQHLSDVLDLQIHMPGVLPAVVRWLRMYKYPNMAEIAYNGACMDVAYARTIIAQMHAAWRVLTDRGQDGQASPATALLS